MVTRKRMDRRWSQLTAADVQSIADAATVEQYSKSGFGRQFSPEFTDALVGRPLLIKLDDGRTYEYTFRSLHELAWRRTDESAFDADGDAATLTDDRNAWAKQGGPERLSDTDEHVEYYESLPTPGAENLIFLQHYVKGSVPPTAHMLVIDTDSGLVTFCISRIGVPASAIEVSREFGFGILDGYDDTGTRHGFTEELVGNAIYWTYSDADAVKVKHIYTAPLYYTYSMAVPDGRCWVASNPADYVKLSDGIYLFAFTEERQAGYQGMFVINLSLLHDVASFFGVNAQGMFLSTTGARGELSDAYSWDMCDTRDC